MAPKTPAARLICLSLVALLSIVLPGQRAAAARTRPARRDLPSLSEFANALTNGEQAQLRGAYAPGLFANRVVQQPAGDASFVSPRHQTLTEFSAAARVGSTGLLAHNYLAGADYADLAIGRAVYLVFGDGSTRRYEVTAVQRFQALTPMSTQSEFIDLQGGTRWSAGALFSRIYDQSGSLVLQTCIAADGNDSWGRLFVIAQPADEREIRPLALSGR